MAEGAATRVAVVGTGLMGTSIALAAARAGDQVRGFDADPAALARASERSGLVAAGGLEACVEDADVVVVCTPIPAIGELAARCLAAAGGAVVTDVGSVKGRVAAAVDAAAAAGDRSRFVGGHPMGGSERTGPDAASAALLDDVVWVLSPGPESAPESVATLEAWVRRIGGRPVLMEPERHDRLVAMVSHLPQLASTALMAVAAEEEAGEPQVLLLAAGGFRDLTRLAGSSPELWRDILRSNPEALGRAIDRFVERLLALRGAVEADRADDLESALAGAKRARLALGTKPSVKAGVAMFQVPVPDRPGVLAELTATLGERAVNIEDLQIVHSPEGGRGTVHLTVAAEEAEQAADALVGRGFEPLRLA